MMYYPFFGALALASGTVIERVILKKKQTNIKLHHCLEFFIISLIMLPFVYFFWQVSPDALSMKNMVLMGLVILFSMVANLLAFYAVKGDKISELEPAKILEPLYVVVLALLFSFFINSSLYETNPKIIYPALIACAALIFSHIKRHHLYFDRYFLAATLGSFFFGLELVTSRLILDYYSAFSFYFLRCVALFLLGIIILKPKLKKLDNKIYYQMVGLGVIWTVYRIIVYYGYVHLGVISTTLIFMLSPIFVYAFAWVFLKEKPSWRNIIASIVIIGCVAYSVFVA